MRRSTTLLRSVLLGHGPRAVLSDLGLLGLRLGFGLSMALQHGRATVTGYSSEAWDFPDPIGLGPELSMAFMAFAELFCALAVAAGLLTRIALVPLVLGMGTAVFVFHAGDPFRAKELAYLYLMAWVALLLAGPGRFSLDRLVSRPLTRAPAVTLTVLLLFSPLVAAASPHVAAGPEETPVEASPTLASFRQAEGWVRAALEALGDLQAAGGLTLRGRGTLDLTTMMQGSHPDRPDRVPLQEELAVDLPGGRVGYESHARVNPDADEWMRVVHDGEERMLIVLHLSRQAFWVPGDADQRRRYERVVPHLLLRDALEQRHTLRVMGTSGDRGAAVSVTLASGESLTLFFDRATGLLEAFEYLLDMPLVGDTTIRWELDPYRPVDGLGLYPTGYRILRGDRPLKEVRYEVIAPGVERASVFGSPQGIVVPDPPAPSDSAPTPSAAPIADLAEVQSMADGVYLARDIRGGFHTLFVELADSVLVVDTPAGYHELQMVPAMDWAGDVTSSSVGRRLLRTIAATVPGKPVRHVVLTHHHADHIGGVRPFLAAGTSVYASATTAAAVERAARATFTLEPDELSEQTITPRIEVVSGEYTISDAVRTVRILDVGENPHAEGMLLVYLPGERILFQSDLFMPSGGSFPEPGRVPVMRWFVDWLDASGLDPETILAIHGSAQVTDEQLEAIRALRD